MLRIISGYRFLAALNASNNIITLELLLATKIWTASTLKLRLVGRMMI
jgi:hypothetical protein